MLSRAPAAAFVIAFFAASAAAQTEPVFTDSLAPGWDNWSWSTTYSVTTTQPYAGTSALAVQHNAPWGGLQWHAAAPLDAASHARLRFAIRANVPNQRIRFYMEGNVGASTWISIDIPTTWTVVEVDTSTFVGLTSISNLVWMDTLGTPQTYFLDQIEWIIETPPPPMLSVNAGVGLGRISPYIYGMNFADAQLASDIRLPVRRWGGNATTRYNWQLDLSNRGSDWYFENVIEDAAPGSAADHFVQQDRSTGTATLMTVPLIGRTPSVVPGPNEPACGFRISKCGNQVDRDYQWRPDCGNGITGYVNGQPVYVTCQNPQDTSMPITPAFVAEWIAHFIAEFGTAAEGGVRFYNLDNEPMLWNSTHRDVHPAGTSYDELRDRTYAYAAAIKQADPSAETLGPVLYGWTAYFYSAKDAEAGGAWWNNPIDRNAHGGTPFVEWYLQQMRAYEQQHGVRILDYLDLHNYPEAHDPSRRVGLRTAGDAEMQARRLRSTRSLWDPTYVDESWINEPVRLIPRMRAWVDTHYPGTKLAITEYNWGGLEHINGALAQADILGIFGREGLDLATLWTPPSANEPGAFAFRMYRNYDGAGGAFGDRRVSAVSTNQDVVSIYAARTGDNRLTIMLINKSLQAVSAPLTVEGIAPAGPARAYRYSEANLSAIMTLPDVSILPGEPTELDLPAGSITLLVVAGEPTAADLDGDGDVDADDVEAFLACRSRSELPHPPGCEPADLDHDGDVDPDDFGRLQRCYAGPDVFVIPDCE
jgi:hypothetical protein